MRRTRGHSADAELARLFDALAPILISLDITPSRLAQIARASFVKTSAKQAKMKSSGRPHLARIAAMTGLTRSEVKRVVVSGYKSEASNAESLPRALRVLNAWRTSGTYAPNGKPRALRILGRPPSFDALCRSFSGDIPYKVILDDLERRRCVVISKKSNRVAIAGSKQGANRSIQEHAALGFATAFLQDALRDELVLVRRKQKIASSSTLSDSYVETAISTRLTDLLDQLPALFANRKSPKRSIVNVFTLVSKSKPKT
jgi:uncharacterized protein DUF6502